MHHLFSPRRHAARRGWRSALVLTPPTTVDTHTEAVNSVAHGRIGGEAGEGAASKVLGWVGGRRGERGERWKRVREEVRREE